MGYRTKIEIFALVLSLNLLVEGVAATIQCQGQPNINQAYGLSCMTKGLKADITGSQSCLMKEKDETKKQCSATDSCTEINVKLLPGQFEETDSIIWSFSSCYKQSMQVQICSDYSKIPPTTPVASPVSSPMTSPTASPSPAANETANSTLIPTTPLNQTITNSSALLHTITSTSSSPSITTSETLPTAVGMSNTTSTTTTISTTTISTTLSSNWTSPTNGTGNLTATADGTNQNATTTQTLSNFTTVTDALNSSSNASLTTTISSFNLTLTTTGTLPTTSTAINVSPTTSTTSTSVAFPTNATRNARTTTSASISGTTNGYGASSSTKPAGGFEGCFTGNVTFSLSNCASQGVNVTLSNGNVTADFEVRIVGCCSTEKCKPSDGKSKPNKCNFGKGNDVVSVDCASECFTYVRTNLTSATSYHGCLDDLLLADTPFNDVATCTDSYEQGSCSDVNKAEDCLRCCKRDNCNLFTSKDAILGLASTTHSSSSQGVVSSLMILLSCAWFAAAQYN